MLPKAITEATAEYFDEQDSFGQWLDERCRLERDNESLWERSTALFSSWSDFAKARGESAGTQRSFNESMRRRKFVGPRKKRFEDGANTPAFVGIQLKRPTSYLDDRD